MSRIVCMYRYIALFLLLLMTVSPLFLEHSFSKKAILAPFITECVQSCDENTSNALSQTYHYLGSGKQSFAFVSNDKKYVIKFFNKKYIQSPFIFRFFSKKKMRAKERWKFYQESYLLAEKELKEETGILYLHLGPTNDLPKLFLKDSLGISHHIDLNIVPFILQKKAEPFYSMLSSQNGSQFIEQFLQFIAKRIEKGIADYDHEIEGNFGIVDGNLIQIDPGRLCKEEGLKDPKRVNLEWWRATHRLRKWLQKTQPDKMAFFEQERNAYECYLCN